MRIKIVLISLILVGIFWPTRISAQAPVGYCAGSQVKCGCWVTTVTQLDSESKTALQKWEREVWQQNPILKPLSDSYRHEGSWGWHAAKLVEAFHLEQETKIVLQRLARFVSQ